MRGIETYVDDAFDVSHQEVPEEPRLIEVTEHDHVIHTLNRGGVHRPDAALSLLVDLVLLYACIQISDIIYIVQTDFPKSDAIISVEGFLPFLHRQSAEVDQCLSP